MRKTYGWSNGKREYVYGNGDRSLLSLMLNFSNLHFVRRLKSWEHVITVNKDGTELAEIDSLGYSTPTITHGQDNHTTLVGTFTARPINARPLLLLLHLSVSTAQPNLLFTLL
jgi:hypothetical protein